MSEGKEKEGRGRFLRKSAGAYLVCYALFIEAGSLPADASIYIGWIYYPYLLSIAVLGFSLVWKLSKRASSPLIKVLATLLCGVPVVIGLYFVPWFIPFEYGDLRWGWSPGFNLAVKSALKVTMLILGTILLVCGDRQEDGKASNRRQPRVNP